jgi:hypothetical protein
VTADWRNRAVAPLIERAIRDHIAADILAIPQAVRIARGDR